MKNIYYLRGLWRLEDFGQPELLEGARMRFAIHDYKGVVALSYDDDVARLITHAPEMYDELKEVMNLVLPEHKKIIKNLLADINIARKKE